MGHLEHHDGMLFLPSWMTPGTKDTESRLFELKAQCISGRAPYEVYTKEVLALLRGKTGYASLRMVISPSTTCTESRIYVPRYVTEECVVPVITSGHYYKAKLSECRYVILVRQPCMWTGGIQPVELVLTDPDTDDGTGPDVNCSIRLPLALCTPFGAHFDGDEMTIFGLSGYEAEMECSAFTWDHEPYSPYAEGDYECVVHPSTRLIGSPSNTTAVCTTICWSDRMTRVKATPVHSKWMTSPSSMIAMTDYHRSPRDLAVRAIASMKIACAKSSSQSDVGASTRRSRIGKDLQRGLSNWHG